MDTETAMRQKWVTFLINMLADFRKRYPGDLRTDEELIVSMLDYFSLCGDVVRVAPGAYLLPNLTGSVSIASSIPDGLPYGRGAADLLCLN